MFESGWIQAEGTPVLDGHTQAVRALLSMVAAKHPPTYRHLCQVSSYTVMLADKLELGPAQVEIAGLAGLLHDVGKISVPDEILSKPGRLTDAELLLMAEHPNTGADMLVKAGGFSDIIASVRYHHEWFDGRGYPTGLSGLAIPLISRMIAICDAFDSMTSHRPYRKSLPVDLALRELVQYAGTQFDPQLVTTFVASVREASKQGVRWAQRRAYRSSQLHPPVQPLALRLSR